MSSIDEILTRGKQMAERLLGRALEYLPAYRNLKELLDATAETETALVTLEGRLRALEAVGYASQSDFDAFNVLRRNTTTLQRRLLDATRRVFLDRPEVLRQLPRTVTAWPVLYPLNVARLLPSVTAVIPEALPDASGAPNGTSGLRGVHGLGNLGVGPAVAAAPVAGLAPWMICAIILAVVAAATVVGYVTASSFGVTAEAISSVLITREQVRGLEATINARMQIFENCMAQPGATAADCVRAATTAIPTQRDAAADVPKFGEWTMWVTIGIISVGVIGLGGYLLYRHNKALPKPQLSGAPARYKPIRAARFPYERAEDQGLPV